MPAIPQSIKNFYRRVVPKSIRDLPQVSWVKAKLFSHDMIYDKEYYDSIVEAPAARSGGTISASIVRDFKPHRVVDVGCGTGALLNALRERGCTVFGLEYSEAGLAYCRRRNLEVMKFDLEHSSLADPGTFDVAVSMEVAEHLPETTADRYVDLLTRLSGAVILTAAPPGQGGADHLNEQYPPYWIAKFNSRGFSHDNSLSQSWSQEWQGAGTVESWYYQNIMVFRRAA